MNELYKEMEGYLSSGEPFVVATVVGTRGSTPRKTSAKMLVTKDGQIRGTIGGGCGEAEVWSAAMEALEDGKSRMVTVDLTTPIDGPDKICGGIMDIFVEPMLPART
jgi:xanthine/CO dehydrogenase XdhC/CoxF family maturation factor